MCPIAERAVLGLGTTANVDRFVFRGGVFAGCLVGGLVRTITQTCSTLTAHAQPVILSSFDLNGVRHNNLSLKRMTPTVAFLTLVEAG